MDHSTGPNDIAKPLSISNQSIAKSWDALIAPNHTRRRPAGYATGGRHYDHSKDDRQRVETMSVP